MFPNLPQDILQDLSSKIYHTVNRLQSLLSLGHLVTRSLGNSVLSSCHPSQTNTNIEYLLNF